ncbi:MAG: translation initiation factor IF-2 [Myxococcales bacterium]|nr:translation initiation factor IF-2 [Myxococcales bacterium]
MGKKRVFELAKELGFTNQDLIEKLRKNGFEVKSHSSTVDEDDVRRSFSKEAERKKASTDEKRVSGTVIRRRSKGGTEVIRRPKADTNKAKPSPLAKTGAKTNGNAKANGSTKANNNTKATNAEGMSPPPTTIEAESPAVTEAPQVSAASPELERRSARVVEAKSNQSGAQATMTRNSADMPTASVEAPPSVIPIEKRTARPVRVPRRVEASPPARRVEVKPLPETESELPGTEQPETEAVPKTTRSAKQKAVPEAPLSPESQDERALEVTTQAEGAAKSVTTSPTETEIEERRSEGQVLSGSIAVNEKGNNEAEPPRETVPEVSAQPEEREATETVSVEAGSPQDEQTADDAKIARSESVDDASDASSDVVSSGSQKESNEGTSRREARAARPDRRARDEVYDDEDDKPDLDLEDFGFSEADFAMRPTGNIETRVAPPPPSTTVPNPKKDDVSKPRVVGKIDPEKLKARLNASKRPEPPQGWGRQKPDQQPGVTEKVMVKDAGGRGKLVDAREVAKNKKSGGRPKREEMSAKELLEAKTKQVFYPTPSRKKPKGKKRQHAPREVIPPTARQPVVIGDTITVAELSQQMSRKANELILWLMRNGVMANINQPIDHDTATMMVEALGYEVTHKILKEDELLSGESLSEVKGKNRGESRAPVVTVMGHVDHGKTSLLDRIRNAKVAEGEAGGITQRIAGYQVETSKGLVTFLDTPGHAAFTSMRARGANVTDIVVLVVAADDGVMPQTREAIRHAKAAGVPMIVAINKIDKPEANPERVLQQLTEHNIIVEMFGGDVLSQRISAKTGEGVQDLLEQLALQSEMMELRAETDTPGVGSVVEGHIHKGRGPVATILVQEGTLRKGDIVVVGESVGKVRAMIVDGGRQVREAGPATPVEILGLDAVPNPGEEVRVAKDMQAAKELAAHRREKRRAQELSGTARVSLQDLFSRIGDDEQKELRLILKGDVQGSVEALGQALTNLSTQKVKVAVISSGVGAVNESDVEFAAASEAIVVGFAVRPDTKALKAGRSLGVDIRTYEIIYEAVDEIQAAMRGLLAPVAKEQYIGRAEVLQTFTVPKVGTVAGCKVVDGIMMRNANIRLLRDSKIIYDGRLASLKRFKDDVREVKEGFECGMGMEKFNDIKVGDIFEAYEIVMTEAALDEPLSPMSSPSAEARP